MMNLDRAREFYSAYYEGGLDDGLRQAFQRALTKDPKVADEYAQFVRIMDDLKNIDRPVEVPEGLHDKIMARVALNGQSHGNTKKGGDFLFVLRPLAYGSAAAFAIIATVVSFSLRPNQGLATGGLGVALEQAPQIVTDGGTPVLKFASIKKNTVIVGEIDGSKQFATFVVDGQEIVSPLRNADKGAKAVRIGFGESYPPLIVVVPGTTRRIEKSDSGTTEQFIKSVSDHFGVTVVMSGELPADEIEWTFESTEILASLSDELKAAGLRGELLKDGILRINR